MTSRKIFVFQYTQGHIVVEPLTKPLYQLHVEKGEGRGEKGGRLAYLVHEYIDWDIQGASLSVYHGDESKSHPHIEPLTVASSVQNLGFLLCLRRQLPRLFSTTFACPAWVEQDKKVS